MHLFKINVKKITNPQTILSIVLQLSLILLSVAYPLLYPKSAQAKLTTAFIRFDRQAQGAALGGVVCMQSTLTSGGVTKVFVQFPSVVSLAGTNTQWTVDTTAANLPNTTHGDAFTATAWPGIAGPEAVAVATTTAIFTSTDLINASYTYCFHFSAGTSGSTTGSTPGTNLTGMVQTQTALGVPVETLNYATAITTGANSEQITVNASVSAQFSFALSGGDASHNLPLGILNSGSVVTAPYQVTATISTNAHNGFLSWVEGTNSDGLHSPTTGTGISSPGSYPTVTDLGSNTGYGIYGIVGTNSPTIAAGYISANGTSVGHVDNAQFDLIASLTGQQSGTTFLISARAKPTATQLAGNDYSDTLTVVASGSF